MATEPTMQPPTLCCESAACQLTPGCPVCGATLVPMRGQYRCSRCYFALCPGCEPVASYETAEHGE